MRPNRGSCSRRFVSADTDLSLFQIADGEIEENVGKFYEDIGVSDEDVMSMVIPWKFGAKQLGVFTEEEFVKGMANVGYVSNNTDVYMSTEYRIGCGTDFVLSDFLAMTFVRIVGICSFPMHFCEGAPPLRSSRRKFRPCAPNWTNMIRSSPSINIASLTLCLVRV